MTATDRRDADDATFAAEMDRLGRLEVADIAADVQEEAVASAIREVWETQDELRPPWIDLARAAIAELATPGTDSSGPAVQRVLDECATWLDTLASPTLNGDPFIRAADWAAGLVRDYAAVAGPQRDQDEEGGQ